MYRSPNIVRVIKSGRLRWADNTARMEEGKRPLERPRRRWENNIRMDLKEIAFNTRNWIDLAQDRNYWRALVNAPLKLRVPYAMELVMANQHSRIYIDILGIIEL